MPKGKTTRNVGKKFENRAKQFERDWRARKGYRIELHDVPPHDLRRGERVIGAKRNKRLILKGSSHMPFAIIAQEEFLKAIKSEKIKPKTYEIVKVSQIKLDSGIGVQQFFNKPTLANLIKFIGILRLNPSKKANTMTRDEALLCKKFLKQPINSEITLEQLQKAQHEYVNHALELIKSGIFDRGPNYISANLIKGLAFPKNVVVLGINRERKLRMAIIDL